MSSVFSDHAVLLFADDLDIPQSDPKVGEETRVVVFRVEQISLRSKKVLNKLTFCLYFLWVFALYTLKIKPFVWNSLTQN